MAKFIIPGAVHKGFQLLFKLSMEDINKIAQVLSTLKSESGPKTIYKILKSETKIEGTKDISKLFLVLENYLMYKH